jgi:hypothetical protein
MAQAESKAAGFNSTVAMLREMCPPERFRALEQALPPETVELVRRPPLPLTWIPNRHIRVLQNAAWRVAFRGDLRPMVELSRRARLADLGTIYRLFVRLASAEFALSRAAKLYTTYTRNNGTLEVSSQGKGFAELTFRGLHDPSPAVWAYCEGAIHAVLEMTGLESGQVKIQRGGGGDPDCTFHVRWSR